MIKRLFFIFNLMITAAASAQLLELKAADAVINGDNIAYESRRDRDCIGSWEDVNATVSWDIELNKSGTVNVSAIQAADSSAAGNLYSVSIADRSINGTVADTGSWGEFNTIKLGKLKINTPGKYQVTVKALSKQNKAVMNLKTIILEGPALDAARTFVPLHRQRGIYFAKKQYQPQELPTFAQSRKLLPDPVLDDNPDYLDMYWKCWELAFDHYKKPEPGSGFVSNYMDEAFNPNIFQWDTIFMIMFARYANHVFPAIQSLDNFYCKQHSNGFICGRFGKIRAKIIILKIAQKR